MSEESKLQAPPPQPPPLERRSLREQIIERLLSGEEERLDPTLRTILILRELEKLDRMEREEEERRRGRNVDVEEVIRRLEEKWEKKLAEYQQRMDCLLYTSPSPRDGLLSRMPSSA